VLVVSQGVQVQVVSQGVQVQVVSLVVRVSLAVRMLVVSQVVRVRSPAEPRLALASSPFISSIHRHNFRELCAAFPSSYARRERLFGTDRDSSLRLFASLY